MADATATPGTIATSVAVHAPTASQASVATPATIATSVTLYTPETFGVDPELLGLGLKFTIDVTSGMSTPWKSYGQYSDQGIPPEYKVVVLEPGGQTVVGLLREASVQSISWILNGMGDMEFTMPVLAEDIGLVEVADREVQVWRGADMIWWGVVVRGRGDANEVTFQCKELAWYFTRRYIGTGERNYVRNGDFEEGFAGWINPNFDPSEPAANRDPANYTVELRDFSINGGKSLYINANANLNAGVGVGQSFLWEVDPLTNPEGDTWYLVGWCYIPSEEWVEPRIAAYTNDGTTGAMGLHMQRTSTTDVIYIGGIAYPTPIEQIMLQIDESVPKDRWVRLQLELEQPVTGDPEAVAVQIFGPVGGIYWDAISIVREEALAFHGVDQATILSSLVEHSQDSVYGKSDLNIGTNCPLTGIPRTRIYYFYNHELVSDTIDEWPGLWQGMDWSIITTPTTRTFTSHYPQRGSFKTKYPLMLGRNISTLKMDRDGEATSNQVLVFADQGDGSAREESVVTDTTALNNGLTLELVYAATPGSATTTLQAQAERGVRRFKNPVELPTITVFQPEDEELLGVIEPGDIVKVKVDRGWYNLDGNYRVMEITLNPTTEEMELALNPYENWQIV